MANTSAAAKIRALLDGLTLEKAAVIADEIKGWDKKGVDDPRSLHYSTHRSIDRQLCDFWRADSLTPAVNPDARLHIIGSIIQTFRSYRHNDTATGAPVAANGM